MPNERPLTGYRILELCFGLAGPFGGMILADMGAEQIKVEPPIPVGPPIAKGMQVTDLNTRDLGTFSLSMNRNKKSLIIDLKQPEGLETFYELVGKSDVVYSSYRLDAIKRLKIDYDTLKQINPKIIFCLLTGYGSWGPYSSRAAFDYLMQAYGGQMSVAGEPGSPPQKTGLSMIDHCGGMYAAMAIMAALIARERQGVGQSIDIALLDTQISFLTYNAMNYHTNGQVLGQVADSGHPFVVPAQNFRTKDGYMSVFVGATRTHWQNLCRAIERPELATDPRFTTQNDRAANRETLIPILKEVIMTRTTEEWLDRFLTEDPATEVPAAPVNTIDKALCDPQVLARNMVVTQHHPILGELKAIGNPMKMSVTPAEVFEPSPVYGQHSAEILSSILGFSQEKIEQLVDKAIVASHPIS